MAHHIISDVLSCNPVNYVDNSKVYGLVKSMLDNGWQGAPILFAQGQLITGSHRQAALKILDNMANDLSCCDDTFNKINKVLNNDNIAIDVTDLIDIWMQETGKEFDDIQYDNLSQIFANTWIDIYADQIKEWI